jgi:SAM-dependent methyltransferase
VKDEAFALMEELEESHWWYRARRGIVADCVSREVSVDTTVVDYGCGTGGISRELLGRGYRIIAADVSERSLAACRRHGLETLDLREQPLRPDMAGAFVLADVLEHVHDDVALLGKVHDALCDGGCVIATVPAYEFLWSGEDFVSEHVRRYGRGQLINAFQGAGFVVNRTTFFNALLFPAIALTILHKKLFKPEDLLRSDLKPLPGWLNQTLYRIFSSERVWLRRMGFPFGASLLLTASKRG